MDVDVNLVFGFLSEVKCESRSVVSNSLLSHGQYSPWNSPGILQARTLEWVVFPFSRGSSRPRDQTQVSHIAGRFFTSWATREAQEYWSGYPFPFPADLPYPGIELGSPASQADSLPTELSEKSLWKLPEKDKRREVCWPRWGWMQLYSPELGEQSDTGWMWLLEWMHRKFLLFCFSCVWLFVTLWTVAHGAPLSMGFPRQEYWSRLLFPSPEDLHDTGIGSGSPELQVDYLSTHMQISDIKAV